MLKEVKIELTNKCSRNCMHCSSNATSNIDNLKELAFEDVCKIIKNAKLMEVETIVFTGGEPLMYDKLSELVKLTTELGMKSTIYTFAYRTDETLNKYRNLISLGLNKIVYSLADSLSNEEDISIYDNEEFFDNIFYDNNSKLGFHYTVSKDSYPNLKNIVTKTINIFKNKKYFDNISLLRFVPHGKGTTNMDLIFALFPHKTSVKIWSPIITISLLGTPVSSIAFFTPFTFGFCAWQTKSTPIDFAKGETRSSILFEMIIGIIPAFLILSNHSFANLFIFGLS